MRDTWETTGAKVTQATLDLFSSGKLLKELNVTILTLIPKVACPNYVMEFRPIASCNTLYN